MKSADFQDQKARQTNNIKHFLRPFLSFRMAVTFKTGKRVHFYGNEQGVVSYNQLLYRRVECIKLSRLKGYTDLINYYEKTCKSISAAAIYMREINGEDFSITCRRWYNGEVMEINDPVIDASNDERLLYYHVDNSNNMVFSETPVSRECAERRVSKETPGSGSEEWTSIDFKKEVREALIK